MTLKLIKQQDKVVNLEIWLRSNESNAVVNEIGNTCKALETLVLKRIYHHIVDLTFLKKLTNLKEFSITSFGHSNCLIGKHISALEGTHPSLRKLRIC